MNDYKEQRLQLVINGVVEYEIEVIGTRKGPTKPGASTRQERYHHAFTRLKRIAERRAKCLEPITWEIYEVYKSKVNMVQNINMGREANYSNPDHITEALKRAV